MTALAVTLRGDRGSQHVLQPPARRPAGRSPFRATENRSAAAADALFYEGTKDTTTDLDDDVRDLRFQVAAGQSVSHTVYLKNKENGGKDYATLELTFTNAS
ncbi:hypothetical protein [Streptomyces sp. NPDC088760]|uniref:hypothetical protein n=1 Tax=Streptomyces sp. NPDC088760 TaxID=3365890 RepID=UPI003803EAB5